MNTVWILTTFEYSTYSYTGVRESENHIFATKTAAEKWAAENGYKVVYSADSDKEVEIEEHDVNY